MKNYKFIKKENNHKIYDFIIFKVKIKSKTQPVNNFGIGNIIKTAGAFPSGLKIEIHGNSNKVFIGQNCSFTSEALLIGTFQNPVNNCTVIIENNCDFGLGNIDLLADNCFVKIGELTKIRDMHARLIYQESSVIIENNCLLSWGVQIVPHDGHKIIDLKNNNVINDIKYQVRIKEHSWIGSNVKLIHNATIPKNSIVGANSLVTKQLEHENSIYAGVPARLIKKNISWEE